MALNYDDDPDRRTVEFCMRTGKALVNPIIDWSEDDVWEFLNSNGIQHCCLYDEGLKRLGCIGCPMGGAKKQRAEFERWPKYRKLYKNAFKHMIDFRKKEGLPCEQWETPEDVMRWWLQEDKEDMPGTATIQ